MAARYWVNGTGTWNSSNTANWSATDGGASGASAPTTSDPVFFTALSGGGIVTITSGQGTCLDADFTGFTGSVTGATMTCARNVTLGTGMTSTSFLVGIFPGGGVTGTLTSNGKTIGSLSAGSSTTGTVKLADALNCGSGAITHTVGIFDSNNQSITAGLLTSNGSSTRTLTLGSSSITLTGSGGWASTSTGLTMTANTATVTLTASSVGFANGGLATNGLSVVMSGSGAPSASGTTYANFTRTGTAAKTDSISFTGAVIVTGTLTINSNSDVNRIIVQSSVVGTSRTITAATVVITNTVTFMDITGAGAATWTVAGTGATYIGDCGGNSGITFTASATQTHTTSAGGNWSDVTKWTSRIPLPQDDVVVDGNTTGTLTADMPRLGRSINFTGFTGTIALTSTATTNFGSWTYSSGLTVSQNQTHTFAGRSSFTVTSAGKTFTRQVSLIAPGGTYTQQDAWSNLGQTFAVTNGTWDTNSQAFSTGAFTSSATTTRGITLGTSIVTLDLTAGTSWSTTTTTGLTFSGASSTIIISTVSSSSRTFAGGGLTYGTLTYTVAGSTGALVISGANTFSTINFSDTSNARTLTLPASTTTTITTSFNVNGTSGKLMTVNSSTSGTAATISKSSGTVICNYLSLQDSTATGGATWVARNSTNVSGNTGWNFDTLLSVDDVTHSDTTDGIALTQAHVLQIADALNAHSVDNIVLTQAHTLVLADALHDHAADNIVLTQAHILSVADTLHDHFADSPTLIYDTLLSISDALHDHLADNITLVYDTLLTIQDAVHDHFIDNIILTQAHTLSISDALHTLTSDNIILTVVIPSMGECTIVLTPSAYIALLTAARTDVLLTTLP